MSKSTTPTGPIDHPRESVYRLPRHVAKPKATRKDFTPKFERTGPVASVAGTEFAILMTKITNLLVARDRSVFAVVDLAAWNWPDVGRGQLRRLVVAASQVLVDIEYTETK